MSFLICYPIVKAIIPGLPKTGYRNGVGKPEGVVCHATAVWDDSDTGERNYEANGNWQNAFVHFFVDHDSITQVADTDYKAWGAGQYANERFIHVELCQSKDPAKFKEAYSRYVWLISYLLYSYGLKPQKGVTLWTHKMVSEQLGGTDHTDPDDYLAYHGVTVEQLFADIDNEYRYCLAAAEPSKVEGTNDVLESAWYAAAVKYVIGKGLMSVDDNKNFNPDAAVTRAMLAQVLYNQAQKECV